GYLLGLHRDTWIEADELRVFGARSHGGEVAFAERGVAPFVAADEFGERQVAEGDEPGKLVSRGSGKPIQAMQQGNEDGGGGARIRQGAVVDRRFHAEGRREVDKVPRLAGRHEDAREFGGVDAARPKGRAFA